MLRATFSDRHLKVRFFSRLPWHSLICSRDQHVPGTSVYTKDPNAIAAATYEGVDLNTLKHGTGKSSHIILVPQPSDDPNDPLNWPTWKKSMTFGVLIYGTVLCGALGASFAFFRLPFPVLTRSTCTGPLVSGAQVEMAEIFGVSLSAISRALGTTLVTTLAISTASRLSSSPTLSPLIRAHSQIIWAALATKLGKRPVYITATVLMMVGCIIAGECDRYSVLLGSRIIQGAGQAPLEFLVGSSIADLYPTHQRGIPVALWTIALLNGALSIPCVRACVRSAVRQRFERCTLKTDFRSLFSRPLPPA